MRRFWMAEAPGRRAWVIPLMGVAAGVGLSFLTVAIDRHYPSGLLPGSPISNAADAQSILTTIAESVVPLTTTVLTVTLVAVQLAMGQFSPRIVRALLAMSSARSWPRAIRPRCRRPAAAIRRSSPPTTRAT